MDLYINHTKVEFSLQNEKSVADLIGSMTEWGNESKNILTGVQIEEKRWDNHFDPALNEILLENIATLSLEFLPYREYALNTLEEQTEWIEKGISLFNEKNILTKATANTTLGGLSWARDTIPTTLSLLGISKEGALIVSLLKEIEIDLFTIINDSNDATINAKILKKLETIHTFLKKGKDRGQIYLAKLYLEESEDAILEAPLLSEILLRVEKQISFCSNEIQSGNHTTGLEGVRDLSESLLVLIKGYRRFEKLKESESNEIIDSIETHLRNIRDCLETSDLVYLSDILEYEFPDSLAPLKQLFINNQS